MILLRFKIRKNVFSHLQSLGALHGLVTGPGAYHRKLFFLVFSVNLDDTNDSKIQQNEKTIGQLRFLKGYLNYVILGKFVSVFMIFFQHYYFHLKRYCFQSTVFLFRAHSQNIVWSLENYSHTRFFSVRLSVFCGSFALYLLHFCFPKALHDDTLSLPGRPPRPAGQILEGERCESSGRFPQFRRPLLLLTLATARFRVFFESHTFAAVVFGKRKLKLCCVISIVCQLLNTSPSFNVRFINFILTAALF